jgi:hypothetical protein
MKATILHDEHGKIIAIAQTAEPKAAGSKFDVVAMVPRTGQRVFETELDGELTSKPLRELHEQFQVDVASSRLVKKR